MLREYNTKPWDLLKFSPKEFIALLDDAKELNEQAKAANKK